MLIYYYIPGCASPQFVRIGEDCLKLPGKAPDDGDVEVLVDPGRLTVDATHFGVEKCCYANKLEHN